MKLKFFDYMAVVFILLLLTTLFGLYNTDAYLFYWFMVALVVAIIGAIIHYIFETFWDDK